MSDLFLFHPNMSSKNVFVIAIVLVFAKLSQQDDGISPKSGSYSSAQSSASSYAYSGSNSASFTQSGSYAIPTTTFPPTTAGPIIIPSYSLSSTTLNPKPTSWSIAQAVTPTPQTVVYSNVQKLPGGSLVTGFNSGTATAAATSATSQADKGTHYTGYFPGPSGSIFQSKPAQILRIDVRTDDMLSSLGGNANSVSTSSFADANAAGSVNVATTNAASQETVVINPNRTPNQVLKENPYLNNLMSGGMEAFNIGSIAKVTDAKSSGHVLSSLANDANSPSTSKMVKINADTYMISLSNDGTQSHTAASALAQATSVANIDVVSQEAAMIYNRTPSQILLENPYLKNLMSAGAEAFNLGSVALVTDTISSESVASSSVSNVNSVSTSDFVNANSDEHFVHLSNDSTQSAAFAESFAHAASMSGSGSVANAGVVSQEVVAINTDRTPSQILMENPYLSNLMSAGMGAFNLGSIANVATSGSSAQSASFGNSGTAAALPVANTNLFTPSNPDVQNNMKNPYLNNNLQSGAHSESSSYADAGVTSQTVDQGVETLGTGSNQFAGAVGGSASSSSANTQSTGSFGYSESKASSWATSS